MPMEGSSEEYEKLALAALKKAASANSDPTYHNTRAAIFAYLAQAAASSEMAESLKVMSGGAGATSSTPSAASSTPSAPSNGSTPGMDLVPRVSD